MTTEELAYCMCQPECKACKIKYRCKDVMDYDKEEERERLCRKEIKKENYELARKSERAKVY